MKSGTFPNKPWIATAEQQDDGTWRAVVIENRQGIIYTWHEKKEVFYLEQAAVAEAEEMIKVLKKIK